MSEEKESSNEDLEKLRIENEIKRIKLSMQHGIDFHSASDSRLSSEAEGQWLDYVQQFEDSYKECKQITVYDMIGRPEYRKVSEIADAELNAELEKIVDLLGINGICLDTICQVEERELYRFITEELFQKEADDMKVEGMVQHYIYEEFHPNHDYDIRRTWTEFIGGLLDKERSFNLDYVGIMNEVKLNGTKYKLKELGVKLALFRDAFDDFTLLRSKDLSVNIRPRTAEVEIDLKFLAMPDGSGEEQVFAGKAKFWLKLQYDYWCISALDLPGFDF